MFRVLSDMNGLDTRNLISVTAFWFFHDIIIDKVMYQVMPNEKLSILQALMNA